MSAIAGKISKGKFPTEQPNIRQRFASLVPTAERHLVAVVVDCGHEVALVGSVVLAGLWFTFAMYAVVVGYGPSHMDKLASATAPVHDLAVRYIGNWYSNLVDLAAISAIVRYICAIGSLTTR